jgi:uncharacterized protein (DUF1800 family)
MPDADDVAHLCRRAGFGANRTELEELAAMPSMRAVVDHILEDERLVGPAVIDRQPRGFERAICESGPGAWREARALGRWWLDRMAQSRFVDTRRRERDSWPAKRDWRETPHPLREKLTLFWHGLLVSSMEKGELACRHPNVLRQHELFRRHAATDYETLLSATSRDPAMLIYLDNWTNTAARPNENYARELLELFSVGAGHFTHADVRAAARAGTGYGLERTQLEHTFDPKAHDSRPDKRFFGAAANWDLTGASRDPDRTDLVAALCSPSGTGPVVARNLAKLMWEYFAHYAPFPPVVDELATAFLASGKLEIRDLLRAIFLHPDFYGPGARNGKVKNPAEWSVMLLRGLEMRAPVYSDLGGYDPLQTAMDTMGLELFHQPSVFGWWRKPESRWIHMAGFQAQAEAAAAIGRRLFDDPRHPMVRLAERPSAGAVDRAYGRFGVRPGAGDPAREQGVRMIDAMRAQGCTPKEQAMNLLRWAVLTPPALVN